MMAKYRLAFLLFVPICIVALILVGRREYVVRNYMSPYYMLVEQGANKKIVVAKCGKPHWTIGSNNELHRWFKDHKPLAYMPERVESKVYVYTADPWNDGEGYVVYLYFNRKGILAHAVLAL